ncbi:hypothetical protein [Pseudomonas sp.]|uniref:hypothetical protein n=1 Tax=Pseudomonas sp. TaxID=306 RepID=UPI002580CDE7|nr:hypothetical protein [Pseudomonas sp.]
MEGQAFLVILGDARSRRLPKVTRRKGEKVTQEQYKLRLSASVQKPKTNQKQTAHNRLSAMSEAAMRIPTSALTA